MNVACVETPKLGVSTTPANRIGRQTSGFRRQRRRPYGAGTSGDNNCGFLPNDIFLNTFAHNYSKNNNNRQWLII
jgi:hypothetical protein